MRSASCRRWLIIVVIVVALDAVAYGVISRLANVCLCIRTSGKRFGIEFDIVEARACNDPNLGRTGFSQS